MAEDLMRRGLKLSHMRLLASLAETQRISSSAENLGITQPAASRIVGELETLTGTKLYNRTGRGVRLTEAGLLFAYRCSRILKEIEDAERDLAEIGQGVSGRVTIGSVAGPAVEFVLPTIKQMRIHNPGIRIEMDVSASDVLAAKLLEGQLDFAVCRLPVGFDAGMFHEIPQSAESVSIVARFGHPLLSSPQPVDAELSKQDWVLPPLGTLLRTTVEGALRQSGFALPERVLTTSSFMFTVAMLHSTDAVAPVATAVAQSFAGTRSLSIVPTDLVFEVEPYSLITRAGQSLTPVAEAAFNAVRHSMNKEA